MKKLLMILFSIVLILNIFTACSNGNSSDENISLVKISSSEFSLDGGSGDIKFLDGFYSCLDGDTYLFIFRCKATCASSWGMDESTCISNLLSYTTSLGSGCSIVCGYDDLTLFSEENFGNHQYSELLESFNNEYASAYKTSAYDDIQPKQSREFLGYFILDKPRDITISVFSSGFFSEDIDDIKVKFPGEEKIFRFSLSAEI